MTPDQALAALDAEWRIFTGTREFREKMAIAQEIAIIEAEAIR